MLVDEEVSSLLNRAPMMRLSYKAALVAVLWMLASVSVAYVLPTTFIGRVLGERGLNTRFEAIEFTIRSEGSEAKSFAAKLFKTGTLELKQGESFGESGSSDAAISFADDSLKIEGKFDGLPGNAKLWSVFLLNFLSADDSDAVEARWNAIAKTLGLDEATSGLSRWNDTICYSLQNKATPGAAQLLVERKSFQIVQWSPATTEPSDKPTVLRLLDYENSPAPKWLPQTLEFEAMDKTVSRFEVLDVQFHKPQETGTP